MNKPELSQLTLRERIGQTAAVHPKHINNRVNPHEYLKDNPFGIMWTAGFIKMKFANMAEEAINPDEIDYDIDKKIRQLKIDADKYMSVPFLLAADAENGVGRILPYYQDFPSAPGRAATRDTDFAYKAGKCIAKAAKTAVSYKFPYKKEWDAYNYVIKENGMYKRILNNPVVNTVTIAFDNEDDQYADGQYVDLDREKVYNNSSDDSKWFNCKYSNPILESILTKYNYSSEKLDDPANIQGLEDRIPNYKGVRTIEELSSTLISALVSFGSADNGFEEELNMRKTEIQNAFLNIVGTSRETIDYDEGEFFLVDGFDFILKNGKYVSSYRQCDGGWSELDTVCDDGAFYNEE